MRYFTGIDNGLDGGIVQLDEDGKIFDKKIMPTIKTGKGRTVDIVEIAHHFYDTKTHFYMLENASKHSPGVLALCSTWYTFGCIEAALKIKGMRYELIQPQKWQREFWAKPKMPKGKKFDTKAAALVAAKKLWPSEDWTKSERATKPHDGLIDAALIAEYCRRKLK